MPTTRIADLIAITSALTKVSQADIRGPRRDGFIMRARQAVYYVARKQRVHSYPQIGRMIGNRDHSTVIHGARKAEIIAERDPDYRDLLARIEAEANAADTWTTVWRKQSAAVTVSVNVAVPLRPMFAEKPPKGDGGAKFHRDIGKGSAALLAALQAA
jgi:hypothetical protein